MDPTASQVNAQAVRDLVPTLHTSPYPNIDPSRVNLPKPYVACIIGGNGAVGGGIARAYACAGATGIVLASRKLAALKLVVQGVEEIRPSIKTLALECDITSEESVAAVATEPMQNSVENPEDFRRAYEVHAFGTFYVARNFIPLLLNTPTGAMSFIVICSISAATVSGPFSHVHYCSSAIIEMVKEQHASKGLFCASIHPGGVESEFAHAVVPKQYMHMMVDDQDLAGSFCVWLTKDRSMADIFNGRVLSCKWDVTELLAKRDEIQVKDLLKFRVAL